VDGRAKHIYSIHRKMQRKQLPLERVFDLFAVRVLVDVIPDCYAALSVVHGLWSYLPGEFDDYVATPKANGYRSIHTAVVGPQGKTVEVQIRTRDMHEQAELGTAPHWRYKEGGRSDAVYERKIEWARRLLAPAPVADGAEKDFLERARSELFADRVYPLTPMGEVVELPSGATPLDFAYYVHTGLGHRCRGARVNGRIVPLTQALANGEVVEIITGKHPAPSRHWLVPSEGYLRAPRSRAKLRAWFKKLDEQQEGQPAESAGTQPRPPASAAAQRRQVVVSPRPRKHAGRSRTPIDVEGMDDLPTTFARCCRPERPQPIVGYFTLARGVTVHRRECPGLARMSALKPERVLRVSWAPEPD
jgi:GTP pyrophosphokinase